MEGAPGIDNTSPLKRNADDQSLDVAKRQRTELDAVAQPPSVAQYRRPGMSPSVQAMLDNCYATGAVAARGLPLPVRRVL